MVGAVRTRSMEGGYVALIAVLITVAVATAAALAIVDSATYRSKEVAATQQAVQARQLAEGCAEEALQLVNDGVNFAGSGTLAIAGNSCSYTVLSTGANTRTVLATATIGNSTKKLQAYVTIGTSTISVTSWQEVP